jgi:hypothetical protein
MKCLVCSSDAIFEGDECVKCYNDDLTKIPALTTEKLKAFAHDNQYIHLGCSTLYPGTRIVPINTAQTGEQLLHEELGCSNLICSGARNISKDIYLEDCSICNRPAIGSLAFRCARAYSIV